MDVYGINYLQGSVGVADYIKYGLVFFAIVMLIFAFSTYLRHRLETKYRDLSIIMLLFLLFMLGVQYEEYTQAQTNSTQSSQVVSFVKQVAKDQGVDPTEVYVNGMRMADQMIVVVNDQIYRVSLSGDGTNYLLQDAYVFSGTINKHD